LLAVLVVVVDEGAVEDEEDAVDDALEALVDPVSLLVSPELFGFTLE
jgi:hypothetical protein